MDGHGLDEPSIRAWKPAVAGIREVLHATFREHVYPPHTHDAWTLFIVDAGAIRYDLDGRRRGAATSTVSVLPPHVVHDGRAHTSNGYRKRVLYLEPETLGDVRIGPAVDRPIVGDARLRGRVASLHRALASPDDGLEAETRYAFVIDRIRSALDASSLGTAGVSSTRERGRSTERRRDADLAEALRAFLDAHAFGPITLGDAGHRFETSPTRLTRAFIGAFGIAPHAYVDVRRLDAARERILAGQPLADVAAELGFVDQAHLTRRFKRFLGTTPGRFARSGGLTAAGGSARPLRPR